MRLPAGSRKMKLPYLPPMEGAAVQVCRWDVWARRIIYSMSSKRRLRRKSCEGKRRYPTIAEAQAYAQYVRRKKGQIVQAYYCRFCSGIHIGHPPAVIQEYLRGTI
jgi:hypothetical protein